MVTEGTSIWAEVSHYNFGDLNFGRHDMTPERYEGQGDFQEVRIGVNFAF